MKKIIASLSILGFLFLFLSSNAFGISFKWDLTQAGYSGEDDGVTQIFDSITLQGANLVMQDDTDGSGDLSVGDQFTQELIFKVTGYSPGLGDDEGLNDLDGYEVTGYIDNVQGQITNVTSLSNNPGVALQYDLLSANLDMYFDEPPDFPQDPYNEITLADGTNNSQLDSTDYTDGTLIGSASLVSGAGNTWVDPTGSTVYDQGSTNIDFKFDTSTLLDGFWLDETGKDFKDYPSFYYLLGFPAVDLDNTLASNEDNITGELFDAKQAIDGSSDFQAVPEPTTMLLFGTGLLGLGFFGRRKFITKKS